MRRTLPLAQATLLLLSIPACLDTNRAGQIDQETAPPATTSPPPVATAVATFEVVYIAGHLGQYDDCRAEAVQSDGSFKADAGQGDCAEPNCGFSACEHAQITVRIKNTSELTLADVALTDIELLFGDDERVLPSEALAIGMLNGTALGAAIEPGDHVDVRVTFRGLLPWSSYEAAFAEPDQDRDGIDGDRDRESNQAKIHVIFASPRHSTDVTSPTLYPISDIDT
ncbi:MAG: hypothetical protein ACI9MR_000708 [Myxococcota bacterium]|jgi:hypothetical protein